MRQLVCLIVVLACSGVLFVATATLSMMHKPRYQPAGLARHRVKLTVFVFAILLLVQVVLGIRPLDPWNWSHPLIITGNLVVFAGLLLRSWAAGLLVKKRRLATEGPYRLMRHPLYAGSILLMFGFSMLTGQLLNCIIAGITAYIVFGLAIAGEEKFLAAKFEERWTNYSQQTFALFPSRLSLDSSANWSFARWMRNREYNAWLGSLLGWGCLIAWYLFR
jgi:protein-S-isoprenylcysteine O-methyltransferase Ste14